MDSFLNKILEASEEEITDIIDNAINTNNGMGMEDVNKAGTNLLNGEESSDPYALDYDKTNSYTQDQSGDMSDVTLAGYVQNQPTRDAVTSTQITSGSETKAVEEMAAQLLAANEVQFTAEELRTIYNECVSDLIRESTRIINEKCDAKQKQVKVLKAKKMAKMKLDEMKDKNKKSVKESANIDDVIANLFGLNS